MSNTKPGFFQRTSTADDAAQAARGWLNHPPNRMSLPHNNKAADDDGDGLVSAKEFQQMFDLDGDGSLSNHELAKAAKLFAMVDKDGDGQLTEEELKQVRQGCLYIQCSPAFTAPPHVEPTSPYVNVISACAAACTCQRH